VGESAQVLAARALGLAAPFEAHGKRALEKDAGLKAAASAGRTVRGSRQAGTGRNTKDAALREETT